MNPDNLSLPFLTRKMLAFEHATTFQIRVQIRTSQTGTYTLRGATASAPFSFNFEPTADRTLRTHTFSIPDLPLWVSIIGPTNADQRGEAYVRMSLMINGDQMYHLASGYIYVDFAVSWPVGNLIEPVPPMGELVTLTGTNRAANNQISETVPANTIWKVKAVRFQFITDANAANRFVHLNFEGTAGPFLECISPTAHAASLTRNYSCFPTAPGGSVADDNDLIIPIPQDIILLPTYMIRTTTTGMQVGDDFDAPEITVERFFTSLS